MNLGCIGSYSGQKPGERKTPKEYLSFCRYVYKLWLSFRDYRGLRKEAVSDVSLNR